MAVNIGPKIGVDGEAEYRKQMNNIIQQAKTLASEMKTVTSAFGKNDSSQKKATAQTQVLTKQIEVQKQRVDMLTQGLEQATKKYGEADTRTLKWKQALNEATAGLHDMENGLEDVKNGMKDAGDNMDDAGKSAVSLGDLIKANIISETIMGGLREMVELVKRIGSGLVDVGKQALTSYADYEQLTGGIKKLFGDAYDQVMADSRQAYKTVGMSANEYMETATNFSASLVSGLSGDTQEAARLANIAITDMADNANTFGTDISSIQNAYQGFAKQTYTMLDNLKLGYGGTQEEMARLINDSGVLGNKIKVTAKTVNDVSFAKIIEAIHEIQTKMNITGTTSKEAAGTISGSISSVKSSWSDLTTAFASGDMDLKGYIDNFVESVKTAASNIAPRIKEIIPNMLEGFGQMFGEFAKEIPTYLQDAIQAAPGLAKAAEGLIGKLSDGIQDALPQLAETATGLVANLSEGIQNAIPQLREMAVSLIGQLAVYLQENLPQMITAGLQMLLSLSGSLRENAGQLVDSAILLVRTLATGLIQALPALIENVPLIVTNIAGIINDNAPKLLVAAAGLIWQLVTGIISNIPVIVQNIPQIVSAIVNVVMAFDWINLGTTLIKSLGTGILNMTASLKTTVQNVIRHPIEYLKGLVSNFHQMGNNLMRFLGSGISGMSTTILSAAKGVLHAAISYIKDLPRQAMTWGKDFMDGLAGGIVSAAKGVLDSVKGIAGDIAGYLHFSRPDKGPLREYEKWMPDMIAGMTKGIYDNAYKLRDAAESMADGMAININGAETSGGNTFAITVNAAPGMSEQQVADLVMQRLQHMVKQREMVFA